MSTIFLLFALLAGLMLGTQGVINSSGAKAVGLPTMLAFFPIVQGMPTLMYIFLKQPSLGISGSIAGGWEWFVITGLMSIAIVIGMTLSISRIGALTAFVLVVLGQIIASAIADNFGLLGMEVKSINITKVSGIFIIIAGVLLLIKSNSENTESSCPRMKFSPSKGQSFKNS